jgi:hypothetical protein
MKRVLLVTPHFPPVHKPDHQRVRMSLPHWREFGWDPTVLCVDHLCVPSAMDSLSRSVIDEGTDIVETGAWPHRITRLFGLGELGYRSYFHLKREGSRLIEEKKIDLVFFSTTVFPCMVLGKYWKKKYEVPYVLDFQDPWVSDYYDQPGAPPPPGGRLKYRLKRMVHQVMEPVAVNHCDHVISVSPAYPDVLTKRYPALQAEQCSEIPFGASEQDFQIVEQQGVQQQVFDANDGMRHWCYIGRGGKDLHVALSLLFKALVAIKKETPALVDNLRLHFIGTSYATADKAQKTIEPLAEEFGLGEVVEEQTARIPFYEAMKTLQDAEVIMLIGSDDNQYTASKLYPCILARRPIFGIFHERSSVVRILKETNAGTCVTFNDEGNESSNVGCANTLKNILEQGEVPPPDTNWQAFEPYTARSMTQKIAAIFDGIIASRDSNATN